MRNNVKKMIFDHDSKNAFKNQNIKMNFKKFENIYVFI